MRYSPLFAFGFIVDFGTEFNVAVVVDFDIAFFSWGVLCVGFGTADKMAKMAKMAMAIINSDNETP